MATLAEYLAALAARDEVIHVGACVPVERRGVQDYYNSDGTLNQGAIDADDNLRLRAGLAVRRRVFFYRRDGDKIREVALDFAVLDLGGAGETVVEEAGGTAKEPPNPVKVFRDQAETWLAANAQSRDSNIIKWWITAVDEERKVARVMTIYDDGAGGYKEQPFIALHDGTAVRLRKDTTGA